MIKKTLRKFSHPLRGLWYALLYDKSFQLQAIGGAIILAIFLYLFAPITEAETLFLGLAWAIILITELQNSSFEKALNALHPELHEDIGRSKDMAAGAVLVSGFFLLFVMATIVFL